jgi:hypothetical protein
VENIVNRILLHTRNISERIKVLNPVNADEDFTDKWEGEPGYYYAFKDFSEHLYKEWQELKKENGVISEGKVLKGLFGDEIYLGAQTSQANIIEKARNSNQLGIDRTTGSLASIGMASTSVIKTNTFYGSK